MNTQLENNILVQIISLIFKKNVYRPTFKSESYVAEIPENSQEGVPVTFLGNSIPEVFDHDLVR